MFKPDDKIGPYKLIRRLGSGSFGVVWLAEKSSAIATTQVAIKIPTEDTVDLDAISREAAVWVSASGHPNVLPIIDADVYDDRVVIVSEYAPDGTLADWLARHGGSAPTTQEAVDMVLGILAGLQHLHKRGIIHRDLKPENILLQGDTPRLADFGIARVLKATSHTAAPSGTPLYMPPEAFDGKRGEHTDIWSAGVIFYQLLAGRLPFEGDGITAIMGAIVTKPPKPIANCPPFIWSAIEKALAKDPADRFASAAEMRQVLRLTTSGDPEAQRRSLDALGDASMYPTLKAVGGAKTSEGLATAENDEADRTKLEFRRTAKLSGRRPLWVAVATVLILAAVASGIYLYKGIGSAPHHSDADVDQFFERKADTWTNAIFSGQGANGGIHEISAGDETAQVWSTAQCLAAVLSTDKDLTKYADRIRNGFTFIENARRTTPSPGWNYYGNSTPFTVTEIAGWVVIAETLAIDSKSPILDDAQRQQMAKLVVRDLDEIVQRQDKNGGFRPIREDEQGFIRTYSTAIALWSLIEARRSATVSPLMGSRYDDNIRHGINWLLMAYKSGQGWVPNPNRPGQSGRFDGLNAQILFVLSRAESTDALAYLKLEQAYAAAKKEFVTNADVQNRAVDKNNSSVPDFDIRFGNTEFMAEGSTFLWFPWTLAELSQLSADATLPDADRTAATNLRSEILDHNYDRLDNYVETGGLMYMFAENLFCTSIYLRDLKRTAR